MTKIRAAFPAKIPERQQRPGSTAADLTRHAKAAQVIEVITRGGGARLGPSADVALEQELQRGCTVVVCTCHRAASLKRFLSSLRQQRRPPEHLVIIDASTDVATSRVVEECDAQGELAPRLTYARVGDALRGLTRQRNLALRWVRTDLVAFFDDDVTLEPRCLAEMEQALRGNAGVIGVGAAIMKEGGEYSRLWRMRVRLGMIGDLRPGRYHRSGISTPWRGLSPNDGFVEGDWLPGCAMMWQTSIVRALGYDESLRGYAQGEDLEFSLRARRLGRVGVTAAAEVRHLHEASGRPEPFRLGYMAIQNRYRIHRRLQGRTWMDVAWFAYAWSVDTLLLMRGFLRPRHTASTAAQIAGRVAAAVTLLRGDR